MRDGRRSMVTDDERRRVAAELRGLDRLDYSMLDIADIVEERYIPDFPARLADLIDPDCEEDCYEGLRTVRAVDREALLALADEMGHPIKQAVYNQTAGVRREHIMAEYARRIREACGVVA